MAAGYVVPAEDRGSVMNLELDVAVSPAADTAAPISAEGGEAGLVPIVLRVGA